MRRRHCKCPKRIIHPTKHNCVHHCTQSVVEHVHPSHTTHMNHHLVKHRHVYPHSTSVANTVRHVNVYGGSFNVPNRPGMNPGGPMSGGMGCGMSHCKSNPHNWCR